MSDANSKPDKAPSDRRNFSVLLGGGALHMMGLQVGDFRSVLPWIAGTLGVAPLLIALIVPLTQLGQVLGQLFIGPQLSMLKRSRGALALAELGSALAIGFAAFFAALVTPELAGLILIASAAGFGVCWGLYTICHQDVIARVLTPQRRGVMMGYRAAGGGLLTMAVTMGFYLLARDALDNKTLLLWIAVGLWLMAGLLYAGIAEPPKAPHPPVSPLKELRRGLWLIRTEPWFAQFLVGRAWLLSIELAIPFYTIHVAQLNDPTASDLVMLVFAISAGLLLSGPIWGRIVPRSPQAAITLGSLMVAVAGAATLLVDEVLEITIPFFHVASFTLLSLGRQGVIQARTQYLSAQTPKDDRPIYISIGESAMGVCGVGVGLALGFAAQFTTIFNPLLCLIALNLTAAMYPFSSGDERPKVGR
ncbi:MAG: MFS transporter [Alphaproteobacteria bacterium]|nr:MFS transporter [Alphaproteobacteria bacterium]